MKELKVIGYWKSEYDQQWPDPAWFVDNSLSEEELTKTVQYLRKGCPMPYATGGYSWCRFRCGEDLISSRELTDGKFIWPENLWHYVREHKVRLPIEFIKEVNTNKEILTFINFEFEISFDWWQKQKGIDQTRQSFLSEDSHGEITFEFYEGVDLISKIKVLKKLEPYRNESIANLKELITKTSKFKIQGLWSNYKHMSVDFKEFIEVQFENKEEITAPNKPS